MAKVSINNTLTQICLELNDNFSNVNYGGCGFVAYLISRQLTKCGIQHHIRTFVDHDQRIVNKNVVDAVAKVNDIYCIRQWNRNGVDFMHLCVQYKIGRKWYGFDTNVGVTQWSYFKPHYRYKWLDGSFPIDVLHKILGTRKMWNCEFDRSQVLPIARTINKHFRELRACSQALC